MAIKTLTITVCDVCHQEGTDLETFRIGGPVGNVRRIDLCPADAGPLRDLLGHTKPARRKRSSREVLNTEAEIPQIGG